MAERKRHETHRLADGLSYCGTSSMGKKVSMHENGTFIERDKSLTSFSKKSYRVLNNHVCLVNPNNHPVNNRIKEELES